MSDDPVDAIEDFMDAVPGSEYPEREREAARAAIPALREELLRLRAALARIYDLHALEGEDRCPEGVEACAMLNRNAVKRAQEWGRNQRELAATHRCKVCGAKWIECDPMPGAPHGSWSLASEKCGPCCDNVAMGEQIEAIGVMARALKAEAACADVASRLADMPSYLRRNGHSNALSRVVAECVEKCRAIADAELTTKACGWTGRGPCPGDHGVPS